MILYFIYKQINLTKTASINEVVELVTKRKENWLLICDLVVDVNEFIGRPLFLCIIYRFYIFVSFTFNILFRLLLADEGSLSSNSIPMYFIVKFFAYFCLLAFAAEKLPSMENYRINIDTWSKKMIPVFNSKVSNISNQLKHVEGPVYLVQNQVSLS